MSNTVHNITFDETSKGVSVSYLVGYSEDANKFFKYSYSATFVFVAAAVTSSIVHSPSGILIFVVLSLLSLLFLYLTYVDRLKTGIKVSFTGNYPSVSRLFGVDPKSLIQKAAFENKTQALSEAIVAAVKYDTLYNAYGTADPLSVAEVEDHIAEFAYLRDEAFIEGVTSLLAVGRNELISDGLPRDV